VEGEDEGKQDMSEVLMWAVIASYPLVSCPHQSTALVHLYSCHADACLFSESITKGLNVIA